MLICLLGFKNCLLKEGGRVAGLHRPAPPDRGWDTAAGNLFTPSFVRAFQDL